MSQSTWPVVAPYTASASPSLPPTTSASSASSRARAKSPATCASTARRLGRLQPQVLVEVGDVLEHRHRLVDLVELGGLDHHARLAQRGDARAARGRPAASRCRTSPRCRRSAGRASRGAESPRSCGAAHGARVTSSPSRRAHATASSASARRRSHSAPLRELERERREQAGPLGAVVGVRRPASARSSTATRSVSTAPARLAPPRLFAERSSYEPVVVAHPLGECRRVEQGLPERVRVGPTLCAAERDEDVDARRVVRRRSRRAPPCTSGSRPRARARSSPRRRAASPTRRRGRGCRVPSPPSASPGRQRGRGPVASRARSASWRWCSERRVAPRSSYSACCTSACVNWKWPTLISRTSDARTAASIWSSTASSSSSSTAAIRAGSNSRPATDATASEPLRLGVETSDSRAQDRPHAARHLDVREVDLGVPPALGIGGEHFGLDEVTHQLDREAAGCRRSRRAGRTATSWPSSAERVAGTRLEQVDERGVVETLDLEVGD